MRDEGGGDSGGCAPDISRVLPAFCYVASFVGLNHILLLKCFITPSVLSANAFSACLWENLTEVQRFNGRY